MKVADTGLIHSDLYERSGNAELDDGQFGKRAAVATPETAGVSSGAATSKGTTEYNKPSVGDPASGNGPKLSPLGFAGAYAAVAAAGDLSNCVNGASFHCSSSSFG